MGQLLRIWKTITDRQRIAVGLVGGWIGAWVAGKVLDFISDQMPAGSKSLTMAAQVIQSYIMNRLVIGLLLGALLVTFGPNLWAYLRRAASVGFTDLFFRFFIVATGLFAAFIIGSSVYSLVVNSPTTYTPPVHALKNADGSARSFTGETPAGLEDIFDSNTELMARTRLRSDFGKWIAVTGALRDVAVPAYSRTRTILAHLGARLKDVPTAQLLFDKRWSGTLSAIPRGGQVFAVCKLVDATPVSVSLDSCEIAPP